MHSTFESDRPLWNRLTWFIWRKKLYSTTGSSSSLSSLPKLLNKAINWKIIFSWNFFGVKISKVFAPRLLPAPHRRWLGRDWLSSRMQSSYSSSSPLHHPLDHLLCIFSSYSSSSSFHHPHFPLMLLLPPHSFSSSSHPPIHPLDLLNIWCSWSPKILWLNTSAIFLAIKCAMIVFLGYFFKERRRNAN